MFGLWLPGLKSQLSRIGCQTSAKCQPLYAFFSYLWNGAPIENEWHEAENGSPWWPRYTAGPGLGWGFHMIFIQGWPLAITLCALGPHLFPPAPALWPVWPVGLLQPIDSHVKSDFMDHSIPPVFPENHKLYLFSLICNHFHRSEL